MGKKPPPREVVQVQGVLEVLCRDLNVAERCRLYATMLDPAGPEWYGRVRKAAVSGALEAVREKAWIEDMAVPDTASDENDAWGRTACGILSGEWEAIAGNHPI